MAEAQIIGAKGGSKEAGQFEQPDVNQQMRELASREPSTFAEICKINGVDAQDFLARIAVLDSDPGAHGLRD